MAAFATAAPLGSVTSPEICAFATGLPDNRAAAAIATIKTNPQPLPKNFVVFCIPLNPRL